ncbi:MAG: GNAT family N-acetyltransferase [Actinomycetes bacterium]
MRAELARCPADQLEPGVIEQWAEIIRERALSPYLSPQFAEAVHEVRGDVRVVLGSRDDRLVLAWPMQQRRRLMAEPVGFGLADAQGMAARDDLRADPTALLLASGNLTYDYDHLVDPGGNFAQSVRSAAPSPFVNVDQPFPAFQETLRLRGSSLAKRVAYLRRRLEREVGPVRVVHDTRSAVDLADLVIAKRAQYRRTGRNDALADRWRRQLLAVLLASKSPECRGVLSVLQADGLPIAWHLGLRNEHTLHYWFPAYRPDFAAHSPGLLLLWDIVESECSTTTKRIDLGTGDSDYKHRLATGATMVFQGSLAVGGLVACGRRLLTGR